jgi:hypothetical protein
VSTDGDGFVWCPPVRVTDGRATFRIRIFDENRGLRFEARCDRHRADGDPGWELVPATLVTQEITVRLATHDVVDAHEQPAAAQPLS